MPSYHAVGVTAALSVAGLQASCSNLIDLRMGSELKKDAARIDEVFAAGRNLPEKPVGIGSEGGAIHFVGDNADIPLFMVEAGDGLGSSCKIDPELLKVEGAAPAVKQASQHERSQHTGSDSSLTSLGVTPTGSFLVPQHEASPVKPSTPPRSKPRPQQRRVRKPNKSQATAPAPAPVVQRSSFSDFERVRPFLEQAGGPQALCLTIETRNKSYLPPEGQQRRAGGKDLKLEVFMNGQLAAVSFVNTRGAAVELKDDTVRFHGTRVHRQMERSWVYDGEAAMQASVTAEERWCAVAEALNGEARERGRNRWGDCPPSAELLIALSNLALPDHLRGKAALGVMDLVITTGKGKKFAPGDGYLIKTTRMEDPEFKTTWKNISDGLEDPFADDVMFLGTELGNMSPSPSRGRSMIERQQQKSSFAQQSSPEVPLIQQHREHSAAYMPDTPSRRKRRAQEIASALNLDLTGVDLEKPVGSFETVRGKIGQRRTLFQRLSDISQMNPKNREKALDILREEFGEAVLRTTNNREAIAQVEMEPSPSKKARLHANSLDLGLNVLANAAALASVDAENERSGTVDPMKLWRAHPAPVLLLPEEPSTDPEALLAQNRIDMALSAGVSSNGPLLRHIASTSPQHTPKKKTRASALANSPIAVPVKEQPSRKTPTPQRSVYFSPRLGSPIPIDPVLTPNANLTAGTAGSPLSTTKRSGRGANRTNKQWDPSEQTPKQALQNFAVPRACKGSVITYAGGECERQIGKARGGEFREEEVVVGMRFIVT